MNFVPRERWGARPPAKPVRSIPPTARDGLVVHHNGPPMGIDLAQPLEAVVAQEMAKLRAVQRWHMDHQGWADIAYSYAVGQSGTVFEGRGLTWHQFANGADQVGADDGPDARWYTVLWLGGGSERPSLAAYQALEWLVQWLRAQGTGRRVLPHNAIRAKPCPGPELTEWAKAIDNQEEDDMTPEQAWQLQAVFDAMFTGAHHGPVAQRVFEIHEGERAVACSGAAGGGQLSDGDVDRIAVRVVDLLAERMGD